MGTTGSLVAGFFVLMTCAIVLSAPSRLRGGFYSSKAYIATVVLTAGASLVDMALVVAFGLDVPAVSFVLLALSLGIVVAFVLIQQNIVVEEVKKVETGRAREALARDALLRARLQIASSQIRPHFMFNAINAISHLLWTDPKAGAEMLRSFERYLRLNKDAIECPDPIPFEREMDHVRCYLGIEQRRFPDMEVRYDIACQDFMVPPLTLQPLVENAVRHGVRARGENGTVVLRTWEDGIAWYMSVDDDGPGFDETAVKEATSEDRPHAGVANVRERIQTMMNGTFTVGRSALGGASVIVRIPKEVREA